MLQALLDWLVAEAVQRRGPALAHLVFPASPSPPWSPPNHANHLFLACVATSGSPFSFLYPRAKDSRVWPSCSPLSSNSSVSGNRNQTGQFGLANFALLRLSSNCSTVGDQSVHM